MQWRFYDFVFGGTNGAGIFVWGAKGGLSAEGAKLRLPKARSPSQLGGLGELHNRRDFEDFMPKLSTILKISC